MSKPNPDTTAMLLNFNLLDDETKRRVLAEIERVANQHGGTVAQTQDYDSNWGGVCIYQP